MFICTKILYEDINSLSNDVCNLFVNTHVRIKIYHCIIYIDYEVDHVFRIHVSYLFFLCCVWGFYFRFFFRSVTCGRCCLCLWIVHLSLPLTFIPINISAVCYMYNMDNKLKLFYFCSEVQTVQPVTRNDSLDLTEARERWVRQNI